MLEQLLNGARSLDVFSMAEFVPCTGGGGSAGEDELVDGDSYLVEECPYAVD